MLKNTNLSFSNIGLCVTYLNKGYYTIFITVSFQVHSITNKIKPFQSGRVFYEYAKLTGALFEHRVIFTVDGLTLFMTSYIIGYACRTFLSFSLLQSHCKPDIKN